MNIYRENPKEVERAIIGWFYDIVYISGVAKQPPQEFVANRVTRLIELGKINMFQRRKLGYFIGQQEQKYYEESAKYDRGLIWRDYTVIPDYFDKEPHELLSFISFDRPLMDCYHYIKKGGVWYLELDVGFELHNCIDGEDIGFWELMRHSREIDYMRRHY